MANNDIALVVRNIEEKAEVTLGEEEKPKEKVASTGSNPEMTTENSASQDEQMESFLRKYWKKMFIASCLLAVLLDPLFLYIPTFKDKDDMKCLRMDTTLKKTAVILRSATDLFSIMDISYQIYTSKELRDRAGSLRFSLSILIDILAILPLPQVMILIFFSKMRRSLVIMNLLVLSQYVPRVLRIYLSFKELQLTRETEETAAWIKGLLNFFMYILASHVVGAVWYFFAIQRMTICWQSGCGNTNGCETSRSFGCRDITFLNDLCPISPSNSTIFDFGLYKNAFESGIHASTDYFQKFSNCFWWGLRHLSSLGSNLEPSVDGWENLFAAFISIIGLLLFLYLIGNLQIYMQLDRGRREDRRHKLKVEKRIKEKTREVERWLAKTGIPERLNNDIKFHILEKVRQEVEEDRDVHLDHIFYTLPWDHQNRIKSCSPLTRLKKVPMLETMDDSDLKAMCDNFKRKKYTKDEIIIRVGKPLEMILFIVDGSVVPENGYSNMPLDAGELYGERVLYWILRSHFPDHHYTVLLATDSVRATGDVEALVLMASDMKSALSRFVSQFRGDYKFREQLDKHLAQATTLGTFTKEELLCYDVERIARGARSLMFGVVPDDGRVTHALKCYEYGASQQIDRLDHEVAVLSLINHENVVKLLGHLRGNGDEVILVFEYAGLRCYELEMSFEHRMVVALHISAALAYLHSSIGKPVVIHQNVNLEHILLDDRGQECIAKLSGFGSSQLLPRGQTQIEITEVVQGDDMMGYVDPEFIESKILTDKVDVYNFGVVLVELLTSPKAYSSDKPVAERNLATFFLSVMKKDGFAKIADHRAIEEGHFEYATAEEVAHLAKRCLAYKGNERPTMQEVHMELKKVTEVVWPELKRQ